MRKLLSSMMKITISNNKAIIGSVFILLTCLVFTSCIAETIDSVKEITYTSPRIIDEELDIGLFSPFEVPLVQEREYEFTATTSYNYVRIHFVNPDKGDKWISLRKLESNIFTQNLVIPKGTKRVELGISNRVNAKDNDVKVYAVYNVISLEDFKAYIIDEEKRRESREDSSNGEKPELESYEKIVIDHKYTAKYPYSLKRGETYVFEVGPFDSSYCIFNTSNENDFSWVPIERNKSKVFKIIYQIPSDAKEFRIVLSSTSTTFIESLVSFELIGEISREKRNKLEGGEKIVISSTSMSTLNIPIEDEKIYKLSVDSFATDYKYCLVFCNNRNGENIDFCVLDRVNDRYETNCFYVPDGTENISLYLSNDYFYSINRIAQINVDDITVTSPLSIGKNIKKINNYKTSEPDLELDVFLNNLDAYNLGKKDPDALVDKCVNYIEENAEDDFEKIKLLHDTLWYLASYDWDSLNAGDYKPWDFRTVLSRGLCVCAGYSRTFVYFCEKMGIRAINVLGTALEGNERTIDEIEKQNHAWTMVELNDGWYLLDLTWDCSNTNNGKRDNKYSCDFLIVEPKEFLKSHFPRNIEKQLIENPYSSTEMLSLLKE